MSLTVKVGAVVGVADRRKFLRYPIGGEGMPVIVVVSKVVKWRIAGTWWNHNVYG